MDHWEQYLFAINNEATLRDWAQRLHFFRFFRAYGGHANDGDSLILAYRYENLSALLAFFDFIKIKLTQHTTPPPQPIPGATYRGDEYSQFPVLIRDTTWIEQPSDSRLAGQPVFIWCGDNRIELSVSDSYDVTEANICSAEKIERLLPKAPLSIIEPPVDSRNCICPKYYPGYFAG